MRAFSVPIIVLTWVITVAASMKYVIITDGEPDDLLAMTMLISEIKEDILFIGTTLLDTRARKNHVEQFLGHLGAEHIKVYAGLVRGPDSYPQTDSTEAARTFEYGSSSRSASSTELSNELVQKLLEIDHEYTIILLTAATDVALYLESKREDLKLRIYMMGGLNNSGNTSFNWLMDINAVVSTMAKTNVDIFLVSPHIYAPKDSSMQSLGISINKGKYKKIITFMEKNREKKPIKFILNDSKTWNEHITKVYQKLKGLKKFKEYQFCTADVITAAVVLNDVNASESPTSFKTARFAFHYDADNEKFIVETVDHGMNGVNVITEFFSPSKLDEFVVEKLDKVVHGSDVMPPKSAMKKTSETSKDLRSLSFFR